MYSKMVKKKNYELQRQAGMLYSVMHILTDGGVKEQVQGKRVTWKYSYQEI